MPTPGYTHSVTRLSPDVEFDPKLEIDAEKAEKVRENALTLLEIEGPSPRDQEIAQLLRIQTSNSYNPMSQPKGSPGRILKAGESIPQLPVLTATEKDRRTHETFHEGQEIEDIDCPFCREDIRYRIERDAGSTALDLPKQPKIEKRKRMPNQTMTSISIKVNLEQVYVGYFPKGEVAEFARWYAYELVGQHGKNRCEPELDATIKSKIKSQVAALFVEKGIISPEGQR